MTYFDSAIKPLFFFYLTMVGIEACFNTYDLTIGWAFFSKEAMKRLPLESRVTVERFPWMWGFTRFLMFFLPIFTPHRPISRLLDWLGVEDE